MSTSTPARSVTPSELIGLIAQRISRIDSRGRTKNMLAPFIWGAPGIGKTEIVRTIAESRASRIVALHLPQFDPTDIKGIPVKMEDDSIKWMPTSYLPQSYRQYAVEMTQHQVRFDYAVDVAVYLLDGRGEEIFRYNDPTLPDMDLAGVGSVTIENRGGGNWSIMLEKLPDQKTTIVIEDKAVIFLDELSAADPSTQNAALQLVLDRRVGEYDVPMGVPVLAAGNREEDGAFVQTLSHPLCNRFVHYTLRPSADDWIEWAIYAKVRPEIIGMIKWDPDALFDYDPDNMTNGQYGFATPRTWKFLSDQYEPLSFYEGLTNGDKSRAEALRLSDFAGVVGARRASQFIGYLQVMHDMPSPEDVISGKATDIGNVERSKSFGLLYALVYNLEHYFQKYYDTDKRPTDQGEEWCQARDNILDFITNNYDGESASWAVAVIFQQTDIEIVSLRSDAFLRMSQKFVSVLSQIGKGRK